MISVRRPWLCQLPAPRFGPTLLAVSDGPTINVFGGYELKLSPRPSDTALNQPAPSTSPGGMPGAAPATAPVSEAEAAAAMAAARAATMDLHGDALKAVFE